MSEPLASQLVDRARPVREGEELDRDVLRALLDEPLGGLSGDLRVEQFPAGHSNLTYLLRDDEREFVMRRPPRGASEIVAGHDMAREYRILSSLHPVWPKVPRPLFFCPEERSPFGTAFYVMERIRGAILRGPGIAAQLPREVARGISESTIDTLAEIHGIDYSAASLADLGRPEGYLERQVEGWTARYEKAATDEIPEIGQLITWLRWNRPNESGAALIHNDFKPDNVVLDPTELTRVLAVLDWEMATIGDPLADLGTTLAYWVDVSDSEELRRLQLGASDLSGNLTRREVVERYCERSGREAENMVFYYVLAVFKIAVIAQQIYGRYRRGLTQDERFERMIVAVRVLARTGAAAVERESI